LNRILSYLLFTCIYDFGFYKIMIMAISRKNSVTLRIYFNLPSRSFCITKFRIKKLVQHYYDIIILTSTEKDEDNIYLHNEIVPLDPFNI